jgi:hypothetical protein
MRLIYEKPRILRWALELKFKRRPIGWLRTRVQPGTEANKKREMSSQKIQWEKKTEDCCLPRGKVKLSVCLINYAQHHEDAQGSGGIGPTFLISTLDGHVVSFTPRPIYPPYPLDRKLCGPQSQYGCCGEEKNLFPLPGIEPWSPSLSLYQLSILAHFYPSSHLKHKKF